MKTLPIKLDDELDAALEAVCAERGLTKHQLAADLLRRYVEAEQLKRTLQDPDLVALYQELASEDVALAEEGMAEYKQMLEAADQP